MFIVHVISYSNAFNESFISFIKNHFFKYDHKFIVYGNDNIDEKDDIVHIKDHFSLTPQMINWMKQSDLIVINGLFGGEKCLLHCDFRYLKKTYLMFWGGDFYPLVNDKPKTFKDMVYRWLRIAFIKNAGGIINLIPGDYAALSTIVKPNGKHFIAPMADDGETRKIFQGLQNIQKSTDPIKILIGNSATSSNNHLEIFEVLKQKVSGNYQIICPLSYGDEQYRNIVIEKGKELFREHFSPITEYMTKAVYFAQLASVAIGIFNNNRQQALGNIYGLLALGTKVYIRSDTTMWDSFLSEGYYLYDTKDLSHQSFSEIVDCNDAELNFNRSKYFQNALADPAVELWSRVFDSI